MINMCVVDLIRKRREEKKDEYMIRKKTRREKNQHRRISGCRESNKREKREESGRLGD